MKPEKRLFRKDKSGEFILDDAFKVAGMVCFVAFIHFVLIFVFSGIGSKPMSYFNIGSVTVYLFCLLLVRSSKISIAVIIALSEVILHSIASVICVGPDFGFQLYLIGLIPLSFYLSHHSNTIGQTMRRSLIVSAVTITAYIICYVLGIRYEFEYIIAGKETVSFIYMVNVIVVCMELTVFIALFTLENHSYQTKLLIKSKELDYLAKTDALTGLYNRRSLEIYFDGIKNDNIPLYFIICDIDDFKKLNDLYGHACGDLVLRDIARVIKICLRDDDFVCRWGGEEIVIVSRAASEEDAKAIAERIRKKIESSETRYNSEIVSYTMTFGIAKYERGMTLERVILAADLEMYEGKKTGKNKVVF